MSRKKRKSQSGIPIPRIRGTHYLTQAGVEVDEIRSLILRRRLQLLVHSYIYYDLNNNLISDDTWSGWAKELVQLQKDYPKIASRVDYHEAFLGFDGSTGFDLPYRQPEIMNKANWLVENYKEVTDEPTTRHPVGGANPGADVIRLTFPQ